MVAALMDCFNMKSMEDNLPQQILSSLKQAPMEERKVIFHKLVQKILHNLVKLPENPGSKASDDNQDGVFKYACEVLTYGLLHAEFNDAIREGDGIRIITCWKFFLLLFRAANRTKYALESAKLLISLQILPERIQKQMIWSRVVNPNGKVAGNVACDLHMEHLNRTAKDALGQHSHLNPKSVSRIGKCISLFRNAQKQFDSVTDVKQSSGKHVRASTATDLEKIVKQLVKSEIFQKKGNRSHNTFKSLSHTIDPGKFSDWLYTQVKKIQTKYRTF